MKKLVLKSGLFRYVNRTATPQEKELDFELWLKRQLTRLGVSYVDPCCIVEPVEGEEPAEPVIPIQEQIDALQAQIEALQEQIDDLETP